MTAIDIGLGNKLVEEMAPAQRHGEVLAPEPPQFLIRRYARDRSGNRGAIFLATVAKCCPKLNILSSFAQDVLATSPAQRRKRPGFTPSRRSQEAINRSFPEPKVSCPSTALQPERPHSAPIPTMPPIG
jgi:hypothetical protein